MSNLRYTLLAALCMLMSISSCQCERSSPPGVKEAPRASDFEAPKPPVLSDAVKPTPAERAAEQPKEEEVAENPPELPSDFPKDIPVVEDAEVAQVQPLANGASNVIFVSAKPVNEITSLYRKKMEDSGWKVTQDFERGNHAFVGFQRGKMIANLQIAEDPRYPGKRLIAVMYEEQKELPFDEF
jgi:hypothetical protein